MHDSTIAFRQTNLAINSLQHFANITELVLEFQYIVASVQHAFLFFSLRKKCFHRVFLNIYCKFFFFSFILSDFFICAILFSFRFYIFLTGVSHLAGFLPIYYRDVSRNFSQCAYHAFDSMNVSFLFSFQFISFYDFATLSFPYLLLREPRLNLRYYSLFMICISVRLLFLVWYMVAIFLWLLYLTYLCFHCYLFKYLRLLISFFP